MTTKNAIHTGWIGMLTATVLVCSLIAAEPSPRRAATQAFMRQKLAWSEAVLEGLTLEKFDLVSKNALLIRDMTQTNQWFINKQLDYMTLTTNFQRSVNALYIAAVDKKLNEATEAYITVARNCVECHRMLRTEQRKNLGQP
jgi:hypothetical protein